MPGNNWIVCLGKFQTSIDRSFSILSTTPSSWGCRPNCCSRLSVWFFVWKSFSWVQCKQVLTEYERWVVCACVLQRRTTVASSKHWFRWRDKSDDHGSDCKTNRRGIMGNVISAHWKQRRERLDWVGDPPWTVRRSKYPRFSQLNGNH